jgi:hypothetical protein
VKQSAPSQPTQKPKKSSGGGGGGCKSSVDNGNQFKEIRCQTGCNKQCGKGGCGSKKSPRLQFGVHNDSAEVDFNVTVRIPNTWTGQDSATLHVGGVAHSNDNNRWDN